MTESNEDGLLEEALLTISNVWLDKEGTEWFFNPTVGDFLKIKRTQGVDFLGGKFPESIYKLIDASEVILAEQVTLNGIDLPELANRIVNDPEGFNNAFLGGVQSFFLKSHHRAQAGKMMAARLDNPTVDRFVFGKQSFDSLELQEFLRNVTRSGSFDGFAKGQDPKSSTLRSEKNWRAGDVRKSDESTEENQDDRSRKSQQVRQPSSQLSKQRSSSRRQKRRKRKANKR